MKDLTKFDPELRDRVSTWETGNPTPDLSGVRAVFFLLQDPLAQQFPRCHEEALEVLEQANRLGVHVVNPPAALSLNKSAQAMAWVAAGVSTPNAHRFTEPAELYDLAENMEFPLLLKNELQHAQSGMKLIKSLQVLHETPKGDLPFPGSVSSFIDVREEYRQSDPDSPLAGHFHKKRALIFGNTVATNHIFFSTNPIVGFKTSTFSRGRSFNPLRRWSGLRNHHDHLQLDYDYWNQRTDHQSELLEAAQVLDLEFAAIDYSTRADGTCILWEANPHFALHLWPLGIYSRQRRLSERLRRQHKLLAGFLQELLDR